MAQVFDTHRLMYRNATLIACKLSDRTTRINFFDDNGDNPPEEFAEAYTNENGYICKGSGRASVSCLSVHEDAIIRVSFNDGLQRSIEWVFHAGEENSVIHADDMAVLNYADGTPAFDPTGENPQTLRDFVERNELDLDNRWEEDSLFVQNSDTSPIALSKWTKLIIIQNTVTLDTVTFDSTGVRDGQLMFIVSYGKSRQIHVKRGSVTQSYVLGTNQGALMHLRYAAESSANRPAVLEVIPLSTSVTGQWITDMRMVAATSTLVFENGKDGLAVANAAIQVAANSEKIKMGESTALPILDSYYPLNIMLGTGRIAEFNQTVGATTESNTWSAAVTTQLRSGQLNVLNLTISDSAVFDQNDDQNINIYIHSAIIGVPIPLQINIINTSGSSASTHKLKIRIYDGNRQSGTGSHTYTYAHVEIAKTLMNEWLGDKTVTYEGELTVFANYDNINMNVPAKYKTTWKELTASSVNS